MEVKDLNKKQTLTSVFGDDFEYKVLKAIIGKNEKINGQWNRDSRFANKILPKINPMIFENQAIQRIVQAIKKHFGQYREVLYYDDLYSVFNAYFGEELATQCKITLDKTKELPEPNRGLIEEQTINFINTRNLIVAWDKIQTDFISKGRFDRYSDIESMLRQAIVKQQDDVDLIAFVDGDHTDLETGKRHIIPTGIELLDRDMNGGLALGEFAVVVAALKVGKTTFASYIANNAAMAGYNVLQIFFEDTNEQVRGKHRAKMSAMNLSAVFSGKNKASVAKKSDEKLKKMREKGGCLVTLKMDSIGTTVADIEAVLERAKDVGVYFPSFNDKSEGEYRKIDFHMVVIDYMDCIKPTGKYDRRWEGDMEVARALENMCSKNRKNVALWSFTQGGRSSLNNENMGIEDMGGGLDKAKVAHFLLTIAKTLEQRSSGLATCVIQGSRVGRDGIVYKNCDFDNGTMTIEFKDPSTVKDFMESGKNLVDDTGKRLDFIP